MARATKLQRIGTARRRAASSCNTFASATFSSILFIFHRLITDIQQYDFIALTSNLYYATVRIWQFGYLNRNTRDTVCRQVVRVSASSIGIVPFHTTPDRDVIQPLSVESYSHQFTTHPPRHYNLDQAIITVSHPADLSGPRVLSLIVNK